MSYFTEHELNGSEQDIRTLFQHDFGFTVSGRTLTLRRGSRSYTFVLIGGYDLAIKCCANCGARNPKLYPVKIGVKSHGGLDMERTEQWCWDCYCPK